MNRCVTLPFHSNLAQTYAANDVYALLEFEGMIAGDVCGGQG
jgi:hypothetical protein